MELVEGKVIQVSDSKQGTGQKGDWHSQEFVIETFGQYPQYLPIKAFNKKAEMDNVQVGSLLKVEVRIGGRKWDNTVKGITQYFAEFTANKIEMLGAMNTAQPQIAAPQVVISQPVKEEDPFEGFV